MAGQTVSLEFDPVDKRKLQQLINNVADGVSTLDPFFDAAEMHMIDSLTRNFEAEGRPTKWQPLKPVTIKMKGSSNILQDSGGLKGSINASNTERGNLSLKIYAGEKHGIFHQYGTKRAPARPFMMFQDEDIKEIENILERFIDDVMK